jgi:hypothetical protein
MVVLTLDPLHINPALQRRRGVSTVSTAVLKMPFGFDQSEPLEAPMRLATNHPEERRCEGTYPPEAVPLKHQHLCTHTMGLVRPFMELPLLILP